MLGPVCRTGFGSSHSPTRIFPKKVTYMNRLAKPLVSKNTGLYNGMLELYISGDWTTEAIGKKYGITARQVQRIAKANGVIRTQAESNRVISKLKNYHKLPEHLKKVRKQLTRKQRYEVLSKQSWCTLCGQKASDGIRLEVDHIDENPTNNDPRNLQVLCQFCNKGKSLYLANPS